MPLAPVNISAPRRLSQWGWLLAVLFFPSGVFLAFGSARLLPWTRAVTLALLSYGCVVGFVGLMMVLERIHAGALAHSAALLGGMTLFFGWGLLLQRIGQGAGYWSLEVERGWRRAGWFAAAVLVLAVLNVAHQILGSRFGDGR